MKKLRAKLLTVSNDYPLDVPVPDYVDGEYVIKSICVKNCDNDEFANCIAVQINDSQFPNQDEDDIKLALSQAKLADAVRREYPDTKWFEFAYVLLWETPMTEDELRNQLIDIDI